LVGAAADLPRPGRLLAARLFSTSALLLLARLGGAAAGFLVQLLLARTLAADDLGLYFTASSLVVVGGVIAAHGYPSLTARFTSRYRGERSARFLQAFVRRAQLETIASAIVIAVAVATFAALRMEDAGALAIAACAVPFVAGFRLYGSLATATRRFALAYLPDVSMKPGVMLVALAIIAVATGGITLGQAMLCMTAATIVLSVAQFALLRRRFPVELRPWRLTCRSAERGLAARWRREAHATLLVAVFSQFLADLAILAATPFLAAAEMGAFGICVKLAFLVGFFVTLTQNLATPDIADAVGKRGGANGLAKVSTSAEVATAATVLALLGCALCGGMVLRLFGADFATAHSTLLLLVAAQLARAIAGPANAVLTLVGERRANLAITASAVAVLVVSMAVLAASFGRDGAALAVLLTTVLWCGGSAWLLHRRTGIRVDLLATLRG
jgi:O-antigen/teichoic acid export membrane protein